MRKCWSEEKSGGYSAALAVSLVEGRVHIVNVLLVHFVLRQPQALADTINMKWITKEPPTLSFNGILINSQLFCAFIKVPFADINRGNSFLDKKS